MKKTILATFGAIFAAFGVNVLNAETTYYLNVSEGGGDNKSWTKPENWTTFATNNLSGALAVGGEAATAFSAEDGFIVPCYNTLRTPGSTTASYEWTGKYLQIGGIKYRKKYETAMLRQEVRGTDVSVTYGNDGLILAACACYMPYYSAKQYHVNGNVTVTADSAQYLATFQQRNIAYNVSLYLHGKFKSAPGTYAAISSTTNGFKVFLSDTTEYYGFLAATNQYEDANLMLSLETDFPGTLVVSTNATLTTAANGTIANLELLEGAVVDVTAGPLVVTNSFAAAGKVRIVAPALGDHGTTAVRQSLVSLPGTCSPEDFEFVLSDGTAYACDEFVTVTEEGITSISGVNYGNVSLTATDDGNRNSVYPSAMTNAAQWSDSLWPTNPAVDYFVSRLTKTTYLRTFDSGTIAHPADDFVFGGHSLTINNAYLLMLNKSFRSNRLVLRNGGTIRAPNSSDSCSLYGPVVADAGYAYFNAYSGYTLTIKDEISGGGDLVFNGPDGASTSAPFANFVLEGINTNFTGTMRVTLPTYMPSDTVANTNKITPRFDRNYIKLYLTDKRNLGSPLDVPNLKALTIENMSRVAIANTTSLTLDDATRGIFINWVGRFYADAGQTLTIASPLAVQGTMWKEGAGTLVLANPAPTFGADATGTTPDADATNHMFRIAGGVVKIAAVDAVNGLDVVVADASSQIVLDLSSEDADFASYGIRNTKTDSPFAADGAANIIIRLNTDEPSATRFERGILTVKSAAYPSVDAAVKIAKSAALDGWTVTRTPRDNGDGTTTMVVAVKIGGTRILLR